MRAPSQIDPAVSLLKYQGSIYHGPLLSGIPPSELVVVTAPRNSFPEFLLDMAKETNLAKFIKEKQDFDNIFRFLFVTGIIIWTKLHAQGSNTPMITPIPWLTTKWFIYSLLVLLTACGGGGSNGSVQKSDTTPPVITLVGDNTMTVFLGDNYQELGATANDDSDGQINVTITGSVDTTILDDYTIVYTATDSASNKRSVTRTVSVISPDTIPPELGGTLFPNTELWGNNVAYRTLDSRDTNQVDKVVYARQGITCFIRRQSNIEIATSLVNWTSTVECLDNNGEILLIHQAQDSRELSGVIKDILLKKNGSLIIAELILANDDQASTNKYYLQLSSYSPAGELINKKILQDPPNSDELYYYSFDDDVVSREIKDDLADGNTPVLFSTAQVQLVEHLDDVYLMAYTYGIKIYKLDQQLDVNLDTQVMPPYLWLNLSALQTDAAMTISEEGEIFVAFEIAGYDIQTYSFGAQAYTMHFNRPLDIAPGSRGIAVEVFDLAGEYQRSLQLDHVNYTEQLVGIIHHNQSLWLGANVRREKDHAAGGTTEWDMLLAQVSPGSGDTLAYHFIDHDKEDHAIDFKLMPNDNFIFSGNSGSIQVDTNSRVSYGNSLLLEVSPEGQALRSLVMSKPRDVSLASISVIDTDQIIFSGYFDGPITHTCDSDLSLCYQRGVVGITILTP